MLKQKARKPMTAEAVPVDNRMNRVQDASQRNVEDAPAPPQKPKRKRKRKHTEELVTLNFKFPKSYADKIREHSERRGSTMVQMVRIAVDQLIEEDLERERKLQEFERLEFEREARNLRRRDKRQATG